MVKQIKKAAMLLCIFLLSFLSVPTHAQNQGQGDSDNHKLLYGLHLGFTENRVDLYHTQGGEVHALEEGNHSFYAPGFRIAVLTDIQLVHYLSLRVMPGVSLFGRNWEPGDITVLSTDRHPCQPLPSVSYKVESVLGELPVDIKFHPFRMGKWQPYLCSGLSYSYDFTALRKDSGNGSIQRLNAHDLRYTCGMGLDYDTRFIKVGVELKAGFGLLPLGTDGIGYTNAFYFHSGPTVSLGLNFEA